MLGQAQNVGGGRIGAVTTRLGSAYRHPAAESFVHGYHLAVGVAAACLVAAAGVAAIGFRIPSAGTLADDVSPPSAAFAQGGA